MVTQLFKICNQTQQDTSKRLTIANQPGAPIKENCIETCCSSIEKNSRYFVNPFAVADIKYKIPGTTLF